jgi:CheY-like chemotaxis protein
MALAVDILIAEDDAQFRGYLRQLLEREGYSIAEAADGIQAVDLARQHQPQCVLLDLGMPGMDGIRVARELRLDPRTRAAHIHCLTGHVDSEMREQALEAGCEMYLTKPVNASELLEVVHQQVKHNAAEWVTGLGIAEARDLLDWLENHGCTQLELAWRGDQEGFAVRCACPQGQRLARNAQGHVCLVPA